MKDYFHATFNYCETFTYAIYILFIKIINHNSNNRDYIWYVLTYMLVENIYCDKTRARELSCLHIKVSMIFPYTTFRDSCVKQHIIIMVHFVCVCLLSSC